MEKIQKIISDLKKDFSQGYEKGHLRTLYTAVQDGLITEQQAAEKSNLSVEEFREKVKLLNLEK
ncbi:MAG: hypothetical protein IJ642_13085 [Oscillospiraceae bacterium]|nr:hypothetical protein [Oscillospiraceae bacterium]